MVCEYNKGVIMELYRLYVQGMESWQAPLSSLQNIVVQLWSNAHVHLQDPFSWEVIFSPHTNPFTASWIEGEVQTNRRDVFLIGDFVNIIAFVQLYRHCIPSQAHLILRQRLLSDVLVIHPDTTKEALYRAFDMPIDATDVMLLRLIQRAGGQIQIGSLFKLQQTEVTYTQPQFRNALNKLWSYDLIGTAGTRWTMTRLANLIDTSYEKWKNSDTEIGITYLGRRTVDIRNYLDDY